MDPGSIPLRSSAACAAWTPRSVAENSFKAPPKVPKPVRTPERKTISALSLTWGTPVGEVWRIEICPARWSPQSLALAGAAARSCDRGTAADAVLPAGLQLSVTLGAVTAHQVLAAVRTEVDHPARGKRSPAPVARGKYLLLDRRRFRPGSGALPWRLGIGGKGRLPRCKPQVGLGVENPGDRFRMQLDRRVPVLVHQAQVGIRTP